MKTKIILFCSIAVLLIAALIGIYVDYFKFEVERYMVKSSDVFIYANFEKISGYIFDSKEKSDSKEKEVSPKTFFKKFRNAFIIHMADKVNKKIDKYSYVIGVDSGYYYPLTYFYFQSYYKKNREGYYTLRDDAKLEPFVMIALQNLKVIPYRGIYLISESAEELLKYKKEIDSQEKNQRFLKEYSGFKGKEAFVVGDMKSFIPEEAINKEYFSSLGIFGGIFEYNKSREKFSIKLSLEGSGNIYNLLSCSEVKYREMGKHIAAGDFYVANNDFKNLVEFLLSEFGKKKNEDYINSIEEVFGFNILEMTALFGKEAVFNFRGGKFNGIISLENEANSRYYFQDIMTENGSYNLEGLRFIIKNGKIYAGTDISKTEIPFEISPETCFYSYIEMKNLYGMNDYRGIFCEVELKNGGKYLESDFTFEKEEFKKFLRKSIEKGVAKYFENKL